MPGDHGSFVKTKHFITFAATQMEKLKNKRFT